MGLEKFLNTTNAKLGSITNPELNETVVLINKLLVIILLLSPVTLKWGEVFVSFVPALDTVLPTSTKWLWKLLFYCSGIMILFSYKLRVNAAILGVLILMAMLFSRHNFSNNAFLSSCLFLLTALSTKKNGAILISVQLSIMYLGAVLDKLFFKDWLDGSFYSAFHQHAFYFKFLTRQFPNVNFALILSWVSIVIETLLIFLVLFKSSRRYGFYLGMFFHISTAVLGGTLYTMFIPILLVAYLALLPSFGTFKLYYPTNKWLAWGYYMPTKTQYQTLKAVWGNTAFSGKAAAIITRFFNPYTLMTLTAFTVCPVLPALLRVYVLALVVLFIMAVPFMCKKNTSTV